MYVFLAHGVQKRYVNFPCSILAEVRTNCTASWNHKPQLFRGKHLVETMDDPPTRRRSDPASGLYQTQGGHQSFLSHHWTEGLGVDPLGITGYTPALGYFHAPPDHSKTQVVNGRQDRSIGMDDRRTIFEPQQFKYIRRVDIDRSQVLILAFSSLIETSLSTSMLVGRQSIFSGNIAHFKYFANFAICFSPCTADRDTSRPGFLSVSRRQDQMLNTLLDGIPGALDPLPPDMAVHCADVVAACLQNWCNTMV